MSTAAAWTNRSVDNYHSLMKALPDAQSVVYGLVDSAADESLYPKLMAEPAASRVTCLFEGMPAARYNNVAPYLITVHPKSPLIAEWLTDGWESHWGIWLSTTRPPDQLKAHLKKFLFVSRPKRGKSYFRFYDPRVLDQVMPVFDPGQRGDFFGCNFKPMPDAFFTATKSSGHPPYLRRYVPKQDFAMRFAQGSKLQVDVFNWK